MRLAVFFYGYVVLVNGQLETLLTETYLFSCCLTTFNDVDDNSVLTFFVVLNIDGRWIVGRLNSRYSVTSYKEPQAVACRMVFFGYEGGRRTFLADCGLNGEYRTAEAGANSAQLAFLLSSKVAKQKIVRSVCISHDSAAPSLRRVQVLAMGVECFCFIDRCVAVIHHSPSAHHLVQFDIACCSVV